jgi:hypothetical protein
MPWRHMGEWRYSSTILHLDNRWRWVVSFTLLLLYTRVPSPRYPLDMRLGGTQNRSGRCGEEKTLTPTENRAPAVQPLARRFVDWAIPTPLKMYTKYNIKVNQMPSQKWIHTKDWGEIMCCLVGRIAKPCGSDGYGAVIGWLLSRKRQSPGEEADLVSISPSLISHGLLWKRTHVSCWEAGI